MFKKIKEIFKDIKILIPSDINFFNENLSRIIKKDNIEILFCSKNEEEGLNLHYFDVIVHLDLPFSPSRIEQRIGRLDRFGRFKHVEQWIILPYLSEKNENLWLIWFEVLKNGFCIFNESISDVQLSLEPIMEKLKLSLINGPNELKESVNYVKEYILEERKYIDAQYTLDRVIQEEESAIFLMMWINLKKMK